jgi:hypothetical protein
MAEGDEPRVIAEFCNYDELINALRARVAELNLSGEQIDRRSGLADHYAQKLLGPNQIRRLGAISLGPFLGALAVRGRLIEDRAAVEKLRRQTTPRQSQFVRSVAVYTKLTTRFLRKIGAKGGENSRKYMSARQARALARRAARARWTKAGAGGDCNAGAGNGAGR